MRLLMRLFVIVLLAVVGIRLAAGPTAAPVSSPSVEDQKAGPHDVAWYKAHFKKPAFKPGESYACFAPGTSEDVMGYLMEQLGFPDGERYNASGGWTAQGDPVVLTWSFAPDGVSIPGGIGEPTAPNELFSRMDALFAGQGGRATWISRFQMCFDRWAALTGVSYVHVTAPGVDWDDGAGWGVGGNGTTRGDVRIGMHPIDGNGNVLAYDPFPPQSDMVLDRADSWNATGSSNIFLRDVVMHEHGHGLGLAHVCPVVGGGPGSGRLMEPFINTAIDGPQHDDIRGGQRLYGDNDEPNNNFGAATDLGNLPVNTTVNRGAMPAPIVPNTTILSIDGDGEEDWYKFTVNFAAKVSLSSVTPAGFTYDSSTQNGDGSCNSGNNVNSLTAQNLAYQIIGTDGSTVLATANSQPAGTAESLGEVQLTGSPGTFYFKVFETGSSGQSQLYSFSFTVVSTNADITPPTPNPMTFASPPAPAGPNAVTMTATTGSDSGTPPVQYFFDFTTGSGAGGADSGWTVNSTYVNSGLTPNSFYNYRVRAGDSAVPQNVTAYSSTQTGATDIETPTGVTIGTVTDTSIQVTAAGSFTNPTFGNSGFFFEMTPAAGSGANVWSAPGDPGNLTATVTGLTPCTQYTFRVKARNFQSNETPFSSSVAQFTTGCTGCMMEGDMNNDSVVDGEDIAGFVRTKLGTPGGGDFAACADMGNNDLDLDIAEFVGILVGP